MFIDKLKERFAVNQRAVNDAVFDLLSMIGQTSQDTLGDSSAVAALSSVLSYFKIERPVSHLTGETLEGIETVLDNNGLLCVKMRLGDTWWRQAGGPVIAQTTDKRMVAFLPSLGGYRYMDPVSGRKRRMSASFAQTLRPDALNVFPDLPKRSLTRKDFFHFCIHILPPVVLFVITLLCLLTALLALCVPIATKTIFSEVIPSGHVSGISPVCGFLLGASLSATLFELSRNFVLSRAKDKFNEVLQSALMHRLLYLPSSFFNKYSSGNLGMRVLSANNVYQLITSQMLAGLAATVFSLTYIVVAFCYAKQMIVVMLYTVVLAVVVGISNYRFHKRRYRETVPYAVSAQDFAYSAILGIRKIKNARAEQRAFAQWASRFSKSEMVEKYRKLLMAFLFWSSTFLAHYVAWKSGIEASDFVAFMSAFGVMMSILSYGLPFLGTIANVSPYIDMIDPILQTEPEDKNDYPQVKDISGTIDINHVSFRYSPDSPLILDDFSLHIPAGQNVALVGRSGCGKSTLMRLLMGFEQPQQGSIFYGQYNISKVNLGSLRQFVGFCPQSIQIFAGTIAENIRFSTPNVTDEDLWHAARIASLDEDIRRMPHQMDTVLGEGGSGLSGGQCQRLLIARAVLGNPKVLFLDEATSALDNITQRHVIENLKAFGCTRIAIAHRLSTVMDCDRIVVIDKGRIVEDGSPKELMEKQGFFYELSKRQM